MTENKINEVEIEEEIEERYCSECNADFKVISISIKDKREKRTKLSCGHEIVDKLWLSGFEQIGDMLSKAFKSFQKRVYFSLPDYHSKNLESSIRSHYDESKDIHKALDRWERILNVFERHIDLVEREEKIFKYYQEKEQ